MKIWWKVFKMKWNSFQFRLIRKLSGHKTIYKMINLTKADVYILERHYKEIEKYISSDKIEKQILKKIDGKLLNVRNSFNTKIKEENDHFDTNFKKMDALLKLELLSNKEQMKNICDHYLEESRNLVKYFKDIKHNIEFVEEISIKARKEYYDYCDEIEKKVDSCFKLRKGDKAIERLARLESRITLLEQKK